MKSLRPLVPLILLLCGPVAHSENWPNWRGPTSNGVSNETDVPIKWDRETDVKWRIDLPERGNSTPIVWEDKIFLTQAIEGENRRTTMCFNREDGARLWESGVKYEQKEPTHRANPYCSASPVTDGERVISWYGPAGVAAYDFEGNELWHRELGDLDHMWGYGSSPILYKDLVMINFGPGNREFLVALDKNQGSIKWLVHPPHASDWEGKDKSEELHGAWNTPKVIQNNDRDELVINWPHVTVAYNPITGEEYWRCDGLGDLSYANPMWGEGVLVALGGYHGPGFAVKPAGEGNQPDDNKLWSVERTPLRLGAGIILDGHLYIPDMKGILECKNLQTGETVWKERLRGEGPTGDSWSSLVLADGNLYLMNKSGTTFVVKAKPEFEVVSVNPLGEHSNASTVISDGEIFVRTDESLWCIGD